MKANEFVKKHGIVEAKRVLHDARGCAGVKLWGRYEFSTDDLKRLVESHELVEEYGGLDKAKEQAERFKLNTCIKMYGFMCRIIADVESCQ